MALLGYDGRVTLKRELPDPIAVGPRLLNDRLNAIDLTNDSYWSGDKVTLFLDGGLPTDRNPEGTAQYGGDDSWVVGDSRLHIADDASDFYRADDTVAFYEQPLDTDVVQRHVFIHMDLLGRMSFYEDQGDALEGDLANRMEVKRYDWGELLVYPYGGRSYTIGVRDSFNSLYDSGSYGRATIGDRTIAIDNALKPKWEFVCDLRGWTLETDAAALDVTPIGAKFGESVKSLVTATGAFDFFIDRKTVDWDGSKLLQLILMTEKGAKARAQFWMPMDRATSNCDDTLSGSLYYECDILFVSSAVSVRIEDAIVGSARFASTGQVALKMGR